MAEGARIPATLVVHHDGRRGTHVLTINVVGQDGEGVAGRPVRIQSSSGDIVHDLETDQWGSATYRVTVTRRLEIVKVIVLGTSLSRLVRLSGTQAGPLDG